MHRSTIRKAIVERLIKQKTFLGLSSFAFIASATGFLLNIYVVNTVTPAEYSVIFLTLLNAKFLSLFFNISTNQLILKYQDHYGLIFRSTLIYGVSVLLILAVASNFHESLGVSFFSIILAFLISTQSNQVSFFTIKKMFLLYNAHVILLPVLAAVLTFITFEIIGGSSQGRLWAQVVAYVVVVSSGSILIASKLKPYIAESTGFNNTVSAIPSLIKIIPYTLFISVFVFLLQNADKYIYSKSTDEQHLLLFCYSLSVFLAIILQSYVRGKLSDIYGGKFVFDSWSLAKGYFLVLIAAAVSYVGLTLIIEVGLVRSDYIGSRDFFLFTYSIIYFSNIASVVINSLFARGSVSLKTIGGMEFLLFAAVVCMFWHFEIAMVWYVAVLIILVLVLYFKLANENRASGR